MKDELDSPQPPHEPEGAGAQSLRRGHGRVPACEDALAQIAEDLQEQARANAAAVAELELRCFATARLGDELELIERSARRMALLVDDLIDVASIRSGKLVLCRDSVRLEDLIEQALEFLRVPVRCKNIQLDWPLPESPVLLRCDEERVLRLLTHLVHLAVSGASENELISIRTWNANEGIRVAITDTGPEDRGRDYGLVAACASHDARLLKGSGAGLGLHLAHAIVGAHGGSIDLELDSPIVGPTTSLLLPRDLPESRHRERQTETGRNNFRRAWSQVRQWR